MKHRLYRSRSDRVLAGVAGGMAEAYGLDPALVRVGWALLILVSGGLFLVLYIVMALVVPLAPGSGMHYGDSPPFGAAATETVPPATHAPRAVPAPQTGGQQWYDERRRGAPRRGGDTSGTLVIGLILILVGAFFLLRQFIPPLNISVLWPIVVIAGGVLLIVAAFARPGRRP